MVNVHHFSGQIVKYLSEIRFDAEILISDESDRILDTGGGIVKAYTLFGEGAPMLIHNVDILSDADLRLLMERHIAEDGQITLLTTGNHPGNYISTMNHICADGGI